jgi:hypothetical protein
MNTKNISELADSFSMRGSQLVLKSDFYSILKDLKESLDSIPSKFVDIDTSYKEIDQHEFDQFKALISAFNNEQLENDLCDVYEALNLYLLIQDRFGEAADWNLKQEFSIRLIEQMERLLKTL